MNNSHILKINIIKRDIINLDYNYNFLNNFKEYIDINYYYNLLKYVNLKNLINFLNLKWKKMIIYEIKGKHIIYKIIQCNQQEFNDIIYKFINNNYCICIFFINIFLRYIS